MKDGVVKWLDLKNSYGVIIPADHSKNIFMHVSQLAGDGDMPLQDGQRIEYEVGEHLLNSFTFVIKYLLVV